MNICLAQLRPDLAGGPRAASRGRAHGVDYLRVRADGRIELDVHVIIETGDGHPIGLQLIRRSGPANADQACNQSRRAEITECSISSAN
jgi:hypothetical protein